LLLFSSLNIVVTSNVQNIKEIERILRNAGKIFEPERHKISAQMRLWRNE